MKQDQFLFIESCALCSSEDFNRCLTTSDYFLSGEEFDLEKCNNCGLIFTNPIVKPEHIGAYYESEKYFSHPVKGFSPVKLIYGLVKQNNLRSKLKIINRHRQSGRLLDIGCGSGDFLRLANKKGWDISGVEPNASARLHASNITGIDIKRPEDGGSFPENSFDVVTMWHVLEHIKGLDDQLSLIGKILSKQGNVFVALPNHESYDASKYGKYWAAWDVPRHLYHFNKKTIQLLFSKHNFVLAEIFPMKWDAYYVSMLSEKYSGRKYALLRALFAGFSSNRKAASDNNYSSLIYCFKRKMT